MEIAYTAEQEALRQELRSYYERILTPEVEEELAKAGAVGPVVRRIVRQMGEDGWLGIGWPKEYGGQGRSPIEQFVFFDESMRAGAPVPMLTINAIGPTIMQYGTDAQKDFFLPKILGGELHFCIGYTEPGCSARSSTWRPSGCCSRSSVSRRTSTPTRPTLSSRGGWRSSTAAC